MSTYSEKTNDRTAQMGSSTWQTEGKSLPLVIGSHRRPHKDSDGPDPVPDPPRPVSH